jgi:N-methylhydantoinase A/oxoprolinase/acetone carboxylase beta subunit
MATFTEIVATVIVHSSAAAYSHFGVTLQPVQVERPTPVERTVARSNLRRIDKVLDCPSQRAGALKT